MQMRKGVLNGTGSGSAGKGFGESTFFPTDCADGFPWHLSLAEEARLKAASGIPWEFGVFLPAPPYLQDTSNEGDAPPAAATMAVGAHLLGFSDEILLHILSHVPSTDLVLNVRRTCRKLAVLCLDKSLTHTVLLQKDYEVRRGLRGGAGPRAGMGTAHVRLRGPAQPGRGVPGRGAPCGW